jgi:predicted O-methyltransferase YrrM
MISWVVYSRAPRPGSTHQTALTRPLRYGFTVGRMTDWTTVDRYLADTLITEDQALRDARLATAGSSMPSAEVTPAQGALLALIARISGARTVLEIGTLTGYSTIWLARAAEHVTTLELDPGNAELAHRHLTAAGVADRVDLRVGPAAATLATLTGSYDLVFIDADKPSNPSYLREALRLSHPGTIIFADNVVRDGAVTDPHSADPRVQGVRRFFEMVAADPRLEATALQTVGSKGWDGFAMIRVGSSPATA